MATSSNIFGLDIATAVIAFLTACLCLMALWSSLTRLHPDDMLPSLGGRAKGIYLPCHVRVGASAPLDGTYMTEISRHRATFVSPAPVGKGVGIELDLSSLPGFPEPAMCAAASVITCEVLNGGARGNANSFLVTVKLEHPEETVRAALATYIGQLAGPEQTSHA